MRIVFIGTGKITLNVARSLIESGHEVVIIEKDKERIDELSDELDCGFIHGDGSAPDTLEEVGPGQTNCLFCLTSNDQNNIIAGLVGRSLGFDKTIIKIEDFSYEHICAELGLEDVIVPTRTISRYLVDMIKGGGASELSNVLRDKARFYTFVIGEEEDNKKVADLDLPKNAKIICFYRDKEFNVANADSTLKSDDEAVLIADMDALESLKKKWPQNENG
jgi:trk system potassium uptake protein TrkA